MLTVLRREEKYPLNLQEAIQYEGWFEQILEMDEFSKGGSYMVRSLYFDTVDDKDFFDKVTEQNLRRKIRLHGPYLDKSLIRNYIGYNWAGEIMEYAPNVRYCEVFLNGEYQGVYLMVEAIDNGDDCRLDLSKTEKNQKAVGYLLRIDRSTEAELDSTANIYTCGMLDSGSESIR